MAFASGHLAAHPVPPGITGALSLGGYQLLADVGGVGAGRLGAQAFLAVAPDPGPGADPGTQITLHQSRLRDEAEAAAYGQLAAQLGYLRLSGYRVALERVGLRSKLALVDPATGAVAVTLPDRAGGRILRGGAAAPAVLAAVRALPAAGPPADLAEPPALREVLLALALSDDSLGGADAVDTADRALALIQGDPALDPAQALAAARRSARGR